LHRAANNSAVGTGRGRTCIPVQIVLLLCAILIGSGAAKPAAAQGTPEEYQVKAAFLLHFAQLVEWPAGALNGSDQSVNLCIFDDEPRRKELQNTIDGKLVGTRVLHVLLLNSSQAAQGCNMLFLSRGEDRRQTAILRGLRGQPVLTVGESDNFLSDGGMIHFHLAGDKIRFDINETSADASHLKISSRLLLLATSVTLSSGQGRERPAGAH
jgi:hypothetical protein